MALGCVLPMLAPHSGAADAPADAGVSATVTVRAPRIIDTDATAPTAFATTIDPADDASPVDTVADVLSDAAGVTVRRLGGPGDVSILSIRGSAANEVQIYLDGIPLSRARNETVNLSNLPLDSLDRIEVYRGTTPAAFAVAGIGGVVNLVTKAPSLLPAGQVQTGYGSFDTRKVAASYSQQVHGVDLLGSLTYLGSAGNFSFRAPDPAPGSPAGASVEQTRTNNAFDAVEGLVKAGYALAPGLRLDLTSDTFYKGQGVPGIETNQSPDASLNQTRAVNYLRLASTDLLADRLDLASTLYGIYERSHLFDPNGDLGAGDQDRHDHSGVVGTSLNATYYAPAGQTLGGFTDVSYETFDPSNDVPGAPAEPNEHRLRLALTGQDQAGFFGDRLLLVPTARYEHVRDDMSGPLRAPGRPTVPGDTHDYDLFNPSFGAQVRPLDWIGLRGNIGRFERVPNLGELYGNTGFVVGNPSLKSETATNRDVGLFLTHAWEPWVDSVRTEYAYFDNDIDDLIVLVLNNPAYATPINVRGARIRGHEVSLQARLATYVRVTGNYTRQDAENRSQVYGGIYDGKQLPGRPRDEVYTRLELSGWPGSVFYEYTHRSGLYLDQANFRRVGARDVHSVGAAWPVLASLTLSFEARNLTDDQTSDVAGFPLPGRAFYGTITATMPPAHREDLQ